MDRGNRMFNLLDEIISQTIEKNAPATLFVTDSQGNVLLSNTFTALTLGLSLEELLRANVHDLVKKGYYEESSTLEAMETKLPVTKVIATNRGYNVKSTSVPILYEDGTVHLVVTMSDESDFLKIDTREELQIKEELAVAYEKEQQPLEIIMESPAMKQIVSICQQVALYDSKILLYGESGTGKGVLSKYIHEKSPQKDGPFISVNCGAIPKELFESEFFGFEKGAFTGALEEKVGLLEAANNGTFFLDEISELPLEMQTKLLQVIESGEVRRIGSVTSRTVHFRLICATNRDLKVMVNEGTFRKDLYYRINVLPIQLPPLRERPEDIIGLVHKYVAQFNREYGKDYVISATDMHKILINPWLGNTRELRNYVERLIILGENPYREESTQSDFLLDIYLDSLESYNYKEIMTHIEKRLIEKALERHQHQVNPTAEQLGIHRSVLYKKMKKVQNES